MRRVLCKPTLTEQDAKGIIERRKLTDIDNLLRFIKTNNSYKFAECSKIAELANAQRENNAVYYIRQDTCFTIVVITFNNIEVVRHGGMQMQENTCKRFLINPLLYVNRIITF